MLPTHKVPHRACIWSFEHDDDFSSGLTKISIDQGPIVQNVMINHKNYINCNSMANSAFSKLTID